MARTPPIPAQQPPDATRTAAGHVAAVAAVQAAVQAAVSVTLAALVWPLIPAARAAGGLASALDQRPLLRPLPEQQVLVRPGPGGARRAATVPGGPPGTGRAVGPLTLGVEEEFVLLDPATGARRAGRPRPGADARRGTGGAAGVDAVPGGDRDRGVHQPGRGRPRAGPAAAAGRGRRGTSGLSAGGLRDRALPRTRAGRR